MIPFGEYRNRFGHLNLVRDDGVVQLTMHSAGSSLVWGADPCAELTDAFRLIADDYHNQVVILTGAGPAFIDGSGPGDGGRAVTVAQLDIGIPMIAAVNGPVRARSDLALLCEVVLAADTAVFPAVSAPRPGGAWREIGAAAREVSVREALRSGLVAEVVEGDRLLDRAWELARRLRALPPKTLRYTRHVFVDGVRARVLSVVPEPC